MNDVANFMVEFGAVRPLIAAFKNGTKECIQHAGAAILNLASCRHSTSI